MENGYGLYSQGSSGWTSMRNEEFQEGDVWEVLNKTKNSGSTISSFVEEPSLIAKRPPTKTKMIPKSMITKNPASQEPKMSRQSAPMNVPDWSKLYGASSKKSSSSWLDPDYNDDSNNHNHHHHYNGSWESEDEGQVVEDGYGCMTPPHEWMTRRARISSFSVCEGAGRTLKGRDLSRVRNAVLIKTGFLESKSNY